MLTDLSLLRCPYCTGNLQANTPYSVRCSCDTYPIIHNILYLKKEPQNAKRRALVYLARGNETMAALTLLDSNKLANYLMLFAPFLPLGITLKIISIFFPSEQRWWRYLQNRTRRATHVLSLSTIGAIRNGDCVMDVGCGTGLFLARAARWADTKLAIGLDLSFFLLYVARTRFVSSDTVLICADVKRGLPIKNRRVRCFYANDCFMYIPNKQGMLREIRRIIHQNGRVFLTHVHNARVKNLGQGSGITPVSLNILVKSLFRLGVIADNQFFRAVYSGSPVTYAPITSKAAFVCPSYSYQLTAGTEAMQTLTIPAALRRYITNLHIDYTEDTELIPNRL